MYIRWTLQNHWIRDFSFCSVLSEWFITFFQDPSYFLFYFEIFIFYNSVNLRWILQKKISIQSRSCVMHLKRIRTYRVKHTNTFFPQLYRMVLSHITNYERKHHSKTRITSVCHFRCNSKTFFLNLINFRYFILKTLFVGNIKRFISDGKEEKQSKSTHWKN